MLFFLPLLVVLNKVWCHEFIHYNWLQLKRDHLLGQEARVCYVSSSELEDVEGEGQEVDGGGGAAFAGGRDDDDDGVVVVDLLGALTMVSVMYGTLFLVGALRAVCLHRGMCVGFCGFLMSAWYLSRMDRRARALFVAKIYNTSRTGPGLVGSGRAELWSRDQAGPWARPYHGVILTSAISATKSYHGVILLALRKKLDSLRADAR